MTNVNLRVTRTFKDKYTGKMHDLGAVFSLPSTDAERINDLLIRGLCVVESIEEQPDQSAAPAAEQSENVSSVEEAPEDAAAETAPVKVVSFREKEYPLSTMRVALEAIGAAIPGNGSVACATKKIESLTDEQVNALAETLQNMK